MSGDNSWLEEDFLVIGSRGERSGNRGDVTALGVGGRERGGVRGEATRKG